MWWLRCKDLIDSYRPDLALFRQYRPAAGPGRAGHGGPSITTARLPGMARCRRWSIASCCPRIAAPPWWRMWSAASAPKSCRIPGRPTPASATGITTASASCNKSYMPADAVVHRLCDVVAKNGCLLLSVPVRGDGTIDEEERKIVEGVASWTGRYGEAIFARRPWRLRARDRPRWRRANLSEGKPWPFEAADIRFTTKGPVLYAMTLGQAVGRGAYRVPGQCRVGEAGRSRWQQCAAFFHARRARAACHRFRKMRPTNSAWR